MRFTFQRWKYSCATSRRKSSYALFCTKAKRGTSSAQERTGGGRVEEGVRRIDVVGAHGQLEAAEPVLHPHPARPAAGHAPGLPVGLLDLQRPPVLVARDEAVDVPLVLADEVAAGGPHGEPDVQGCRAPRVRFQRDLGTLRLGLANSQRVAGRHPRISL